MRGRRHDVGVAEGRGIDARRDETRVVRHVDHEERAAGACVRPNRSKSIASE